MRESTVSRSYGETLYALGERHGQEAFAPAIDELASLLEDNESVRRFLETPKIPAEAKKVALRRALHDGVPELLLNFVLVVVEKRRQRLLLEMIAAYRALLDERLGRVRVNVTLAAEPDERQEEEIAAELSRILGKTVIPQVRVDEAILGGIVVRYGDHVLDGSLRRRLLALRRRLLETELASA